MSAGFSALRIHIAISSNEYFPLEASLVNCISSLSNVNFGLDIWPTANESKPVVEIEGLKEGRERRVRAFLHINEGIR